MDPQTKMARSAELGKLVNAVGSGGPEAPVARKQLMALTGFDDVNMRYFLALYEKQKSPTRREALAIFEEGKALEGKAIAYPTAIAPPEMLKQLPYVEYSSLQQEAAVLEAKAKDSVLWVKKMQAGTGSSMTRTSYLARQTGRAEAEISIGAKGTDLFVSVPDPVNAGKTVRISLAEAQILQAVIDARRGRYAMIAFHDIVGPEVHQSVRAIWEKPSLPDPKKSYRLLFEETGNLVHSGETFQHYVPTLDEAGRISLNRQAPAGHALFGIDALTASYREGALPKNPGNKPVVSVVGNGEDLSSTPDPLMVGWMVKNRVPIAMVTTEKTANDLKGGQIALVKDSKGSVYASIIEQAQAKEAGQVELFERLGLDVKRGNQIGFFNTNMALFNYDVLMPKLKPLVKEVGEEEFFRIIAPDLIVNWKEQKDFDGVPRKYLQLEGAMGSTLLNLDRYWRGRYGEPLVHFINVDRNHRTNFFSPIKSAFDYFMQFHSDRFAFDAGTMRLRNLRPGHLPSVTLKDASTKDKFYQDVQNVMDTFGGASILDLQSLTVDGRVGLQNVVLKGKVTVINEGEQPVDLAAFARKHPEIKRDPSGKPIFENVTLRARGGEKVEITAQ